jgi:Ca2+-transporting ATPase
MDRRGSGTPLAHSRSYDDVLHAHATDGARGLTATEAARRLAEVGPNALPEAPRKPWWRVLIAQVQSPLILLLVVAAAIAAALGERADAAVIVAVVVVNALVGALQEGRAERSMASLRKQTTHQVVVVRDGQKQSVPARAVVPGDLLVLEAGDAIVADGRLVDVAALEVDQAAMTGESVVVRKDVAALPEDTLLADRANMVYAGTHVTAGRGRCVVDTTGTSTELGQIARLTSEAVEPKTPMEVRLAAFGRALAGVALALFAVVMLMGWMRGLPTADLFMVAVSQMVSLVPEGLPVAMTVALAVSMQRMAARGAIVRRLSAVETLGSTDVICTDKTGTLTRNEMTVTQVWLPDGRTLAVSGVGYAPEGVVAEAGGATVEASDPGLARLVEALVLCNHAQLTPPDDEDARWRALGDPTEVSLLTFAAKAGVEVDAVRGAWPRDAEIPFDPTASMMATQHAHAESGTRVRIKGAPEAVVKLCARLRTGDATSDVDAAWRARAHEASESLARAGLRVLAAAELDGGLDPSAGFGQFVGKTTFLGLVGQMDPPREEVGESVATCRRAGIRPVMVTGDHKETGLAIARSLGIAQDGDQAIDGRELDALSEPDLRSRLDQIAVFARVHPAQKLRIVTAFQAGGHVVAMTGDGVNDAPALARADVGVAMGITGTEVAKGAAKIVLTDDNFATLVRAVAEGRLAYANVQKLLLFLISTSTDEVILLLLALGLGYPVPLAAVQILWINVVTEGTLTVNLVMEGAEGDELERPPVRSSEPLITRPMLGRMVLMVTSSVAVTFGFYLWRLASDAPFALVQTETFTLLACCQWFNVLNCESELRSALQLRVLRNRWLLAGLVLANALQALVVYAPFMHRFFHTVPIPLADVALIGCVASVVLWTEELRKLVARRRARTA